MFRFSDIIKDTTPEISGAKYEVSSIEGKNHYNN